MVAVGASAALVLGAAPAASADPPNQPPVAVPDSLALLSGASGTLDPVANDTDPDVGAVLTLDPASLAVTGGSGTAAALGGNVVGLAAPAGYVGPLVVTYQVTDQQGARATGTITATVSSPPNQPPVANPDSATVVAGGQVLLDPRGNDSDPDGDPLTLTAASVVSGSGSVTVVGPALAIAGSAAGTLVIGYSVADGRGGSASSTVSVTVTAAAPPPNRAPIAGADVATVQAGRTITVPVLANDGDPDGDALRLAKVRKPSKGTAQRVGSSVRFRAPKSAGTVRVRYVVADARGARTEGSLTVTVTAKPKPAAKPKPNRPAKPASGGAPSRRAVEAALSRLGLPGGSADGRYDTLTRRAVCAWRTVTGRPASRALPSAAEARAIVATGALPGAGQAMVTGLNVSITCQVVFWVGGDRDYRRIMAGTTGIPRTYGTRVGVHRIFVTHRVWRTSTIYPEARMYKPMQFSGGQALHGSATDRLVKPFPASHGCVRMLHRDIDALQSGGVGNGTLVRVFGRW
jgi:hypothetical protein